MPIFTTGSATVDPSFPLDNSMGAMMIGVVVSAVLHGLCLLQAFFYYQNYKNDHWYFKSLVATVVFFDAVHLAFITHAVYHYVISEYHHEDQLLRLIWSVLMEAVFTGVNAGIVQTFYVVRVFRLSRGNYWLSGVIMLLILATTGCGFAWVIISMRLTTYKELININPLTITINALSTTVDISIAVSLCYMLHKSRTGFKKSDGIINKLIVFVVNTGVLTTLCAIASLIALIVSPQTLIYATFYFCIGRFYTNSFIATLNARRSIKSKIDEGSSHMMLSMPTSVAQQAGTGSKVQNISIRIDTLKEAQSDSKNMQKGGSVGDLSNSDGDTLSTKTGHAFREQKAPFDSETDKKS